MKPIINAAFLIIFLLAIFASCKKDPSCEGCRVKNKPPIAVAGPDQIVTLPTDSVMLDGRSSRDPDGMISNWLWTKISGPASLSIGNSSSALTVVRNLVAGIYLLELKVTDDGGSFAKDTLLVTITNTLAGREVIYNGAWGCNDLCQDGDVYWDSSPWNDGLYSNPNTPLEVSIKVDLSSPWLDVPKFNSISPPGNQFYWQIDRGYLWVFAYEGKLIGTPVTVRVKFL